MAPVKNKPKMKKKQHVTKKKHFQTTGKGENEEKPKNDQKKKYKKFSKSRDDEEDEGFEEVAASLEFIDKNVFLDDGGSDAEGDDIAEGDTRKLVQKQNRKNKKSGGFQSMGLSHSVFTGVFRKGYKIPTPIQRKTIPLILDGKDVVAMARTGSGKTAAFLIPMFELLKVHSSGGTRALILSPTRELALQTLKFTKELGKFTGLRAAVILGGDSMEEQFAALHESPDIIIATPGRFMHVVMEMDLKLQQVQYVVFDEADRLFEMGFQEQLNEVLRRLPEARQTLLFSATLPRLLVEFARAGLHDPTLLRLDVDTKLSQNLKLAFFQCRSEDKTAVLLYMLRNIVKPSQQTVLFVATKHHVEYLNMILREAGISCSYTYSSLDQTARKINVAKFRNKKTKVLIVTDLAARGIDIPLLDNVINYNFPAKPKLFVHRVGRCARAGQSGVAYSLVSPDEVPFVIDLHLFLGRPLEMAKASSSKEVDGLYGTVPQTVIDDEEEHLRAWHARSDISDMKRVIQNAYKLYVKSRQAPSSESIKRSKQMAEQKPFAHPIFGHGADGEVEEERHKLIESMRSYRPQTTIFEINASKKTDAFSVMKAKRDHHSHVIELNDRKLALLGEDASQRLDGVPLNDADDEEIQASFKRVVAPKASDNTLDYSENKKKKKKKKRVPTIDSENYLHYKPKDYQTEKGLSMGTSFEREAVSAMMDVTGDEDRGNRKIKGAMKWDRKRKRFTKEDPSDDTKGKKIRTESGAWIPATYKSNIYKDWLDKSKVSEQARNADSDDEGEAAHKKQRPVNNNRFQVVGSKQRRGRGIFHTSTAETMKGAPRGVAGQKQTKPGRRELKNKDEILKKRRKEAKQQSFMKAKQQKHARNQAKAKKQRR